MGTFEPDHREEIEPVVVEPVVLEFRRDVGALPQRLGSGLVRTGQAVWAGIELAEVWIVEVVRFLSADVPETSARWAVSLVR